MFLDTPVECVKHWKGIVYRFKKKENSVHFVLSLVWVLYFSVICILIEIKATGGNIHHFQSEQNPLPYIIHVHVLSLHMYFQMKQNSYSLVRRQSLMIGHSKLGAFTLVLPCTKYFCPIPHRMVRPYCVRSVRLSVHLIET